MRPATRIVVFGGVGLLAATVVAAFLLVRSLDSIVASAIEDVGSRVTGTPVRVASVEIALREARGSIGDLTVANPEGFASGPALRVGHAGLALDPASIGQEVVRIRELAVDRAGLTAEILADGRMNLAVLEDRMAGGDAGAADGAGRERRLVIERFSFTGAELTLIMPGGEQYQTTLPPVRLQGVGERSGGVTAAEAGRQLLAPVYAAALKAARRRAVEAGVEGLRQDAVDKIREKMGLGGG